MLFFRQRAISDLIAGLYAALGVVAALVARGGEGDGCGQQVESTLVGGLVSMLAYLSAEYFATGRVPERTGNDHPIVAPYGLFSAADGKWKVYSVGENQVDAGGNARNWCNTLRTPNADLVIPNYLFPEEAAALAERPLEGEAPAEPPRDVPRSAVPAE